MFQKKNKEMNSLNTELSTFYAEELEQRLETDPLGVGGIIETDPNFGEKEISPQCLINFKCGELIIEK